MSNIIYFGNASKDMMFTDMKIIAMPLVEWLIKIPNRTRLVKLIIRSENLASHAIGIFEEDKISEIYILRF